MKMIACFFVRRYLNIYVGTPDVEEGFNMTKPICPHEVLPYLSVSFAVNYYGIQIYEYNS